MAVAFVSHGGLAMLELPLSEAVGAGAHLEFLIGLDMKSTDPQALAKLYAMSKAHPNVGLYCYVSRNGMAIYHPKVYLAQVADRVVALIGSSNLTEGGLRRNTEVNVVIEGTAHDEVILDIYETYHRLKFHPKRVIPDDETLQLYAQLCERQRREERKLTRDSTHQVLLAAFQEKVKTLQPPKPTQGDLVGWLGLVHSVLPDGVFTNDDIYRFEEEFRRRYPRNSKIRDKIRQQLQELRDMRLIEHLARGKWRKPPVAVPQ